MWTLELVKEIEFFNDFSESEKKEIAALKNLFCPYDAGKIILQENEHNNAFFILMQGVVHVLKEGHPRNPIGIISMGETFGEMSYLTDERCSSSIKAATNCTVMQIEKDQCQQLSLEIQNKIKDQLIKILVNIINRKDIESMKY